MPANEKLLAPLLFFVGFQGTKVPICKKVFIASCFSLLNTHKKVMVANKNI